MLHWIVVLLLLVRPSFGDFLDDSKTLLAEYSRFVVPLCDGAAFYWRSSEWKKSAMRFELAETCNSNKKISNVILSPICEGYPGKLIPVIAGFTKAEKWEKLSGEKVAGNQTFVSFYECVDKHETRQMKVPEGCWSDRLVGRGVCRTESLWMETATEECGQAPLNFTISTQCGANKFLEIEYVCCNAATRIDPTEHIKNHQKISSSVHKTALALLKEFASMNRRLDDIFARSDGEINDLYREFGAVSLPPPPFFTPLIKEYLLNWIVGKTPEIENATFNATNLNKEPILSRKGSWHKILVQLHQLSLERTHHLFLTAFTVATDEEQRKVMSQITSQQLSEITMLIRYDQAEVLKHFESVDALEVTVFPELKAMISSTWLDYCMNHTWGIEENDLSAILKDPHAHGKILQRYHAIFAEAAKDQHVESVELSEDLSQTKIVLGVVAFTLLIVAIVFVALVQMECCALKVSKFKNEKIDHFVRFGKDDQDVSVEIKK